MTAKAEVDAGICGFQTRVRAESQDGQSVTFAVASGCEKVRQFGAALAAKGPVDAYAELGSGSDGVVLSTARESLKACCAACVVPSAVFKAMQVAASVALPKDISVRLSNEDP